MSAMEAVSYLLFCVYLANFFALSAVAARQAGRSVWLFSKGKEQQTIPAWLFRIAFAGGAFFPALRAVAGGPLISDPVFSTLDGVTSDIVGHLLVAVGAMIAAMSQMHMGASWRIGAAEGETGTIVDTGPFALSRNPVFVGQIILFLGLLLVFPDIFQALLTVALIIAIRMQVKIEERVLAVSLGEPYLAYSRRVDRWFGARKI
jgi:protein-S-isoprenylcysteine O-methyltransferase Ste14